MKQQDLFKDQVKPNCWNCQNFGISWNTPKTPYLCNHYKKVTNKPPFSELIVPDCNSFEAKPPK